MLIYIRGAGDIASGIAIRLRRSGFCATLAPRWIWPRRS